MLMRLPATIDNNVLKALINLLKRLSFNRKIDLLFLKFKNTGEVIIIGKEGGTDFIDLIMS
ncbi:uncharacterized protein ASCRUDRAFT_81405 [Ascoidea rubescens DSM 1968]|uniref:Uncharacterized protein n=1 Tax=Ascoidea rubescens DSM 1968 TaxID=1344418 RepID=A0A1D2VFK8_9ASCO|nr:hypothetical protein ASCRUDRAFT_81405 [Ascoidea rubescens DSM 1968]ODV60458.1 hypothetical protein ASCRUDRAFT_81405 [Ascoidea rubescens DSM 1968]